ncbi:chromosomal replication initiator protein DnaA [Patescibacteria group bacterium]|nr:chromosomal replication initiator protein DnaA [Patescibacteria group bacterium]
MTEEQLSTTWKSVMHELELYFSPAIFQTWFKHSHLLALTPGKTEIGVENSFAIKFIKKFAEERLIATLSKEAGFPIKELIYTIQPRAKTSKKIVVVSGPALFTQEGSFEVPVAEMVPPEATHSYSHPQSQQESNLNPKYTFSSFIVGTRNRLAHAAALGVAEKPGQLYNPLYLYGGVGLGKTHLMQAVGNEIIRREPQKRVLYVSCENFTNEFVAGIRAGKQESFKKKYRNVDVFLVDDIQFMAGKDGIQEEFFHTFNALYQTDKQIIITSDKAPSDINDLEERLSSRFSMGMIADMQLPDLETRQAILLSKCQEKGVTLPNEVLAYIADQIETNIRELEGALTTVLLHIQATGTEPTVDLVQSALRNLISRKPLKKSGLEQIREVVCRFYDITPEDIIGQRRQKELVKPRQVLMYLLKNELRMTFPTIGREIGGRDHTTAMHGVEKIEKELKKSAELSDELQRIKELYYTGSR